MNGSLGSLALTMVFYGLPIAYLLGLIPAAYTLARRESWVYFIGGLLTFGIVWYIGALHVLNVSLRAVLIGIASILLIGFFSARPAILVGVDGRALQNSVDRWNSLEPRCNPAGADWICARYDNAISGDRPYRLKVNWMGCWKGTAVGWDRADSGATLEPKISGCLTLKDLL